MKNIVVALLIWAWPLVISIQSQSSAHYFVVWNVGQGLWTTWISPKTCLHFDSGGESAPFQKILRWCGTKPNHHHLSHLDWDHMSFVKKLMQQASLCRVGAPTEQKRRQRLLFYLQLPVCPPTTDVQELSILPSDKSNHSSRVFILLNKILLPGDSPIAQEKHWSRQIKEPIDILVLGHHGSRTSTGLQLLKSLGPFPVTVASARKGRYGHPHRHVVERLESRGIPLLLTEDWGNIWFERRPMASDYRADIPYPDPSPRARKICSPHKSSARDKELCP